MPEEFSIGTVRARPGQTVVGELTIGRLNDSSPVNVPLLVAHGSQSGPVVWLGAAIHGIELGGSEVIRRVMREELDPLRLRGTVIGAPIMNPLAFRSAERTTPYDKVDMNRVFGEGGPSLTRTMAHTLYDEGISLADYVVDYHSCNPPSLDFTIVKTGQVGVAEKSLALAQAYGVTVTSAYEESPGTLTGRAMDDGKPAVCVELVFSRRIHLESVDSGVLGTMNMLKHLGMVEGPVEPQKKVRVLPGEYWYTVVYATAGGLISLLKGIGDKVSRGETFAIVRSPLGDVLEEIKSPQTGYVIAYPMQGNQALGSGDKLAYIAWPKA